MKYNKEILQKLVTESESWRQVTLKLDRKPSTGSQTYIKKKAIQWNIDFSHFKGQAINKGKTSSKRKDALTRCFIGSNISSHKLKNLLIRDGYKNKLCESCGIDNWLGEPVVLELDHINNNHYDNRIENLKILCPNCHALKTRKALVKEIGKPQ